MKSPGKSESARSTARSPTRSSLEDKLLFLQNLPSTPAEIDATLAHLRAALRDPNNLVVARAAEVARSLNLRILLPGCEAAFRRFLEAPGKKDPQCWAKNALSKALHFLGCEDASLFLQGMRLHQYDPTWGGSSDVAGTLRSNCAHALVDRHELGHHAILLALIELLTDKDKAVRNEAVRAIAHAGGDDAVLLLRLYSSTAASEEPATIGTCFSGLLALEGRSAFPFVAGFLAAQDEHAAEAAMALGETRTSEAFQALAQYLQSASPEGSEPPATIPQATGRTTGRATGPSTRRPTPNFEPWFATALLTGIALTRQPEAIDLLLALIAEESMYAEAAVEAMAAASFSPEIQQRLAHTIQTQRSPRLTRTYQRHFS